jgi:hypothetical protein
MPIVDTLISPDAESVNLTDLLRQVDLGFIKIPDFQREYVWRERNVLDLLDSISNGYPIGSFLLWQVRENLLRSVRNIGGFELPTTPDNYPIDFVLDGQQRLTTSFALLKHGKIRLGEKQVPVYFDLREQSFVADPATVEPYFAPLDVFIDGLKSTRFLLSLQAQENADNLTTTYALLQSLIQNYKVPIIRIKQRDVKDVAKIFERINNTGQRLRLFDLMVALTYSPTFYLRQRIREVISELDASNFGELDEGAFLQLMAAVQSGRISRDAILEMRESSQELAPIVDSLSVASKKAVDYLRTDLFVFADDLLPYERQFVALAYVFAKRTTLNATERRVVERWFLSTSFSERYRRGGEGIFGDDLKVLLDSVDRGDLDERFAGDIESTLFAKSEFRKGSALSHAFASILARKRPRSIWDATPIVLEDALSSFNRKEFHHIFPRSYLIAKNIEENSVLANFCLLPAAHNKAIGNRPPAEYFAVLRQRLGDAFDEVMAENYISQDAVAAAEANDFATFVAVRAAYLKTHISALI